MKFILLIAIYVLYMQADVSKKTLSAIIVVKNADLYKAPKKESKKIVNYFSEGDKVSIYYCDTSYKWCKTSAGFIRKEQLKFIVPKKNDSLVVEETIVVDEMLIVSHDNNKTIENPEVVVNHYKEYFSKDAAIVFPEK